MKTSLSWVMLKLNVRVFRVSKYLVSVGEVKGKYSCFVCFDCADLQEVIEIFSDMTLEDIKDYKLILGSNILNEAYWDDEFRGAYGVPVSTEHALLAVDEILQKQGLSIEVLKCKIET